MTGRRTDHGTLISEPALAFREIQGSLPQVLQHGPRSDHQRRPLLGALGKEWTFGLLMSAHDTPRFRDRLRQHGLPAVALRRTTCVP